MITDIFFDLDHTLWDFDRNSALAFAKIFQEEKYIINIEDFVAVYNPINQACWKLYQVDKISHQELRYNRLRQSFEVLHFSISDAEIDRISHKYIDYLTDNNHLLEGAIEILEYLKTKYDLHIITNGIAEVQYKKLDKSDILKYFKTITNSEMAGVKKPHAQIFEYALTNAQTQKENAVMIGDCIEADVKGAVDFGIKAVFLTDIQPSVDNGYKSIRRLSELKNLL